MILGCDFLAAVRPPRLFFLSTRGTRTLFGLRLQPNDALVFGNEGSGLPPPFYSDYRDRLVTLPMPAPTRAASTWPTPPPSRRTNSHRQVGRPHPQPETPPCAAPPA
jgi:hypothetical protein